METHHIGRILMLLGVLIFAGGLIFTAVTRFFPHGGLPGDIYFKRGNFTFFFPLATSIIVSIILTALINLLLRK